MELRHIPLTDLTIAAVNVRHSRKSPDVSDLLPSIQAYGILQPLLVRAREAGFEVVAGRRRYFAAKQLATLAEAEATMRLPCAVLDDTDDAVAMEASLIENIARLPMDDMEQYEIFAKLIKLGRTIADIANHFGITELTVKRRLALANLLAPLRAAYRHGAIDPDDIKLLTMASRRQQQEWLGRFAAEKSDEDGAEYAPRGHELREWLLGGRGIPVTSALFPVVEYTGAIATDLFQETGFFLDRDLFWSLQDAAIAGLRDRFRSEGWKEVIVMERGSRFQSWQFEQRSRKRGGLVYIEVRESGEVELHEGYRPSRPTANTDDQTDLPEDDASGTTESHQKPELSSAAQNYVGLHRHAMVRASLLARPDIALRLVVAHLVAGSTLWAVKPEPQRAQKPEIDESIARSAANDAFAAERVAIRALLDREPEDAGPIARPNGDDYAGAVVFARLLQLSDADVTRVLTFLMGETLAAGSLFAEAAGFVMNVSPQTWWNDAAGLLDLIRERRTLSPMLADVAGAAVADGNVSAKASAQKQIILDCLNGNGREKVEGWIPAYLRFPIASYLSPNTVRTACDWSRVADLFHRS